MADSSPKRICPVCGHLTEQVFCPKEGASTVVTRSFAKHPRNYVVNDLVATRYRITGALGSGGYAAVYSAEHTGTGQQVAVKLMSFDPTADGGAVAVRRFFREARITAALVHPNTVRVFDVGQDEGGAFYIAMELLHGESLEELLKRELSAGNTLSVEEALDIVIPVLDSLMEAHDKQLVHRDLKPANIFLVHGAGGARIPKVLDFGIARTLNSSLTAGGTIPGTPPFMSPEQCRGETLDGRSDLYSLAVLLFLCVVGRLPHHHTNVLQLMRMHAFDPPPDPRSKTDRPLPDGLVDVLMRSLAKQPVDRPADAVAMRDELMQIRAGTWLPQDLDGDTQASLTVVDDLDLNTATQQELPSGELVANEFSAGAGPSAASDSATPDVDAMVYVNPVQPATAVPARRSSAASAAPARRSSAASAAPARRSSAASDVVAPSPATADAATAAAVGGISKPILMAGLAALLTGGVAMGIVLGRRSPNTTATAASTTTASEAAVEANIALHMAEKATEPAKKLDYALEAVRLDPSNKRAAALVRELAATHGKRTPAYKKPEAAAPKPAYKKPEAVAPKPALKKPQTVAPKPEAAAATPAKAGSDSPPAAARPAPRPTAKHTRKKTTGGASHRAEKKPLEVAPALMD